MPWYDKPFRNTYKWPRFEWKGKIALHKIWDGDELEYQKVYSFHFSRPSFSIETKSLEKLIREIEDKPDKRWKEGQVTMSAPIFEVHFGIFAFSISYEHDMFKHFDEKKR
jgi:hypothetical protein